MREVYFGMETPGCGHRPPIGADPCDCGLWWHESARTLWVNAQDFLGPNGYTFLETLFKFGAPALGLKQMVGAAALTAFQKSFPGAVPLLGLVTVDICTHEQGKGVTS